jgi:hypothetical protein
VNLKLPSDCLGCGAPVAWDDGDGEYAPAVIGGAPCTNCDRLHLLLLEVVEPEDWSENDA